MLLLKKVSILQKKELRLSQLSNALGKHGFKQTTVNKQTLHLSKVISQNFDNVRVYVSPVDSLPDPDMCFKLFS